jgi:hypothetical protein
LSLLPRPGLAFELCEHVIAVFLVASLTSYSASPRMDEGHEEVEEAGAEHNCLEEFQGRV